jgi:hypothetical protein
MITTIFGLVLWALTFAVPQTSVSMANRAPARELETQRLRPEMIRLMLRIF